MKKFFMIAFSIIVLGTTCVFASNDKPITVKQLPAQSQQFISQYFPDVKVSLAKEDKEFMSLTYDVVLTNGVKLEFYKNGDWKEVNCEYSLMPEGIVPAPIIQKVKELYPDANIAKIDKDRKDYEVKLSNGLELKFDLKFNLVSIDD